jgi:hypothetical protein
MSKTTDRLPSIFICGFTKCGTSALHNWLIQHPEISAGVRKELNYLTNKDSHFYTPGETVHEKGLDGFAALLPQTPRPQLFLDSTPTYAYQDTARRMIAQMPHKPLLIFVTRAPEDQIASTYHYFSNRQLYIPPEIGIETFFEMVLDGRARDRFEQDHLRYALDWAAFDYWLALWRRDIGEDRLLHLDMRSMLADPQDAVRTTFRRMNIDPDVPVEFIRSNETYFVRNRQLQKLNAAVRTHLPRGKAYDLVRKYYRKMNTSTAKPTRSDRETSLRKALAEAVKARESELMAASADIAI